MNLQPVNALPKFSYVCVSCRRCFTSLESAPIADLDGVPFQSYYCTGRDGSTPCANGAREAVIA
jgi:hypothetical protein